MNYSIQEKRRASIFPKLDLGFTHKTRGRSGMIYYRTPDRMLELYTELSGDPKYNILIWEEGLEKWVYPDSVETTSEEQTHIFRELKSWLKKNGYKSPLRGS